MKKEELVSLLEKGFCPLIDELLPSANDEGITEIIESDEGEYFYFTYKATEVTRVHPLGSETNLVLIVCGNC